MKNNLHNNYAISKTLSICYNIIYNSNNEELISHSQNTVYFSGLLSSNINDFNANNLLFKKPEDQKLELIGLAHEIERVFNNRLNPLNFQSFFLYKQASLIRSAEILEKIMIANNVEFSIIKEIINTILLSLDSSKSYNENSIIFKESDSLSFLQMSIQNFFINTINDNLLNEICLHEIKKLTSRGKNILLKIKFHNNRLQDCIDKIYKEESNGAI
jgi:hypothetical protein